MKYKLKDPEKDAAIRILMSDEEIDKEIERQWDSPIIGLCKLFDKEEIKEFFAYNRKGWNEFPKVTPPEDVWMRIVTHTGKHLAAKWDGANWIGEDGWVESPIGASMVDKFRPWEDD